MIPTRRARTPRWAWSPRAGDEAVKWADIQQWESALLQTYAVECENKQRKLQTVGDALASPLNSLIGSGQTVKAAKAALRKQTTAIEKEVNFLISSAEIASEGAQGINEIRANADDAKQLANTWGMSIDASGNVSMDAAQVKRHQDSGRSEIAIRRAVNTAQQRVNAALLHARALVESLSQKMSALDAGTYDNNVHYSATKKVRPSLPPPGASAQEVASWWSSLSDDDKQWMINQHPDVIGNLEGVDYTSRNQANRIMLPHSRIRPRPNSRRTAKKQAGLLLLPRQKRLSASRTESRLSTKLTRPSRKRTPMELIAT